MTLNGIIASATALLVAAALSARWARLWLALTLAGTAALGGAAFYALGSGRGWEWRSGFPLAGERLHLQLDGLSAWFLALVAVAGAAGAVYARGYWNDAERPESAG